MADVSFGEWLKRRRGTEGWTQKELAQRIHCSIHALRKYEAEERHPSVEVVEQLAIVFKIPSEEQASFLRFARGNWDAFSSEKTESVPWHSSNTKPITNLPSSITSFIGREKEQDDIISLFSKSRLVTLAGVGGIGKTRLSLQVGQKALSDYPDGVWFIPLDSLSDPALVPQTVAQIFNIRESQNQPVVETLKRVLHQKTALLIIDNCEHLLDTCAHFIKDLLSYCPSLRILTTSRELLKIEGEAAYYLPPLSTPENNAPLETVFEYESVRLFVERATLALSTFQLTNENAQFIVGICHRVDGIPLSIELIAARVNILSVNEISEQLQKSFAILASDDRTILPRHRTLQASLDWSWSLLTEPEQVFLSQLSVFAGGWTLDAAHTVCDGNVLDMTGALVKKSLMVVDQKTDHETRYRFHEIVHQYTHQKLVESMNEESLRTQHLNYFFQLTEQAEIALRGPEQVVWETRLYDERDNIRSALEWASNTDVNAGMFISGRLWQFWEDFDLHEGEQWLNGFLDDPKSSKYPLARAKALFAYGILSHLTLQKPILRKTAEECLAIYRTVEDRHGEVGGLLLLGRFMWISQKFEAAFELYQEALLLTSEFGGKWERAYVLTHLGWWEKNLQQLSIYWNEAISLSREIGDWRGLIDQLEALGHAEVLHGKIELAQGHLDEALNLSKELKSRRGLGKILRTLSFIETYKGNYAKARSLLDEAIEITFELGHRMYYLSNQVHLGALSVKQEYFNEARAIFLEVIQEFMHDGIEFWVVCSLEGMANLFSRTDKHKDASRLIGFTDAARERSDEPREPIRQADIDKIIADCLAKIGEAKFSDAYGEGKNMTIAEAVAYVLEEN